MNCPEWGSAREHETHGRLHLCRLAERATGGWPYVPEFHCEKCPQKDDGKGFASTVLIPGILRSQLSNWRRLPTLAARVECAQRLKALMGELVVAQALASAVANHGMTRAQADEIALQAGISAHAELD